MDSRKFNTNVKCSGCVQKIENVFRNEPRIKSWNFDMSSNNKTLIVNSENVSEEELISLIKKAGYIASTVLE